MIPTNQKPLPPEQDEPIFFLSHVLLMHGGGTQVPTVVQGRLSLLVEVRVTDAGLQHHLDTAPRLPQTSFTALAKPGSPG